MMCEIMTISLFNYCTGYNFDYECCQNIQISKRAVADGFDFVVFK